MGCAFELRDRCAIFLTGIPSHVFFLRRDGCNPSNNGIVVVSIKCYFAQEKTFSFQLYLYIPSELSQVSLSRLRLCSVSTRSSRRSQLLKDGAHSRTKIPVMLAQQPRHVAF